MESPRATSEASTFLHEYVSLYAIELYALRRGRWRRARGLERRLRAQSVLLSNRAALKHAVAVLAATRGEPLRALEVRTSADPETDPPVWCVQREDMDGTLHIDLPMTARVIAQAVAAQRWQRSFKPEVALWEMTWRRQATYRVEYYPSVRARTPGLDPRYADELR